MQKCLCFWIAVLAGLQFACSKSPQVYVDQGNTLAAQGKFEEARIQYRNSIEKNPKFAEAYYRLALIERYQNQLGDALNDLHRAVDYDPTNEPYAIELASASIQAYQIVPRQNLYDQAAKEAQHLLQKNPRSFDGLRLQGDLYVIDRKYDEAMADFRKANALNPNTPSVVLAMTEVLFAQNRSQEAEALAQNFLKERKDNVPMYDLLARQYKASGRTADAERLLKSEVSALPTSAHARLELAALYRQLGRRQDMEQVLQSMSNDRTHFSAAPALIGDFYADRGNWESALGYYRNGVQQASGKDQIEYQKRIEHALEALGKRDEALQQVEEILKSHPKDPDMRFEEARLTRESNSKPDAQRSVKELKALTAEYPQNPVGHYQLALSYIAIGDSASAYREAQRSAELAQGYIEPRLLMAELAQSSQSYTAALEAANQVLALNSNNFQAKLLHAAALVGDREYDQARTELNALARIQPNSKEVDLELAALAAGQKDYAKAEGIYKKYYHPGSSDLRPLEGLLAAALVRHQPDKAITLLQDDLKQEPDSRQVRMLLASVASQTGKYDLAAEQYKWMQAKDPKSAENYVGLGDLYQRQGLTREALASYEKARDLAPKNVRILNAVAVLQTNAGYNQEAITTLNQQLALDPDNAVAMNNLAFELAETGKDLDRALTLAQTVARKYPNNPVVMDTLGWVYTKHGMTSSADRVLRSLVSKYPKVANYHYHLATALLQENQPADAKREFLAALNDHPSAPLSSKIQDNLAHLH